MSEKEGDVMDEDGVTMEEEEVGTMDEEDGNARQEEDGKVGLQDKLPERRFNDAWRTWGSKANFCMSP